MYRSENAFGFVVLDEGNELDTLKMNVSGLPRSRVGVFCSCTINAAPITGHDKFNFDSPIMLFKDYCALVGSF
jgi:hypothetical protein